MFSKIDIRDIVSQHYKTLYDNRKGGPRPQDYLTFIGVPLVLASLPFWIDLPLSSTSGLLAAVSLLGGLLFALLIMVLQMAADTSVRAEKEGEEPRTFRRVKILRELAANVSYTVLIAVLGTIVLAIGEFVLPSGIAPVPGQRIVEPAQPTWFSALVLFVLSHLVITILMILKRTYGVTRHELDLASVSVSRH